MSGKEPSKQQKKTSPRLRRRSNAPSDPSPEASRRAVAILEVLAGQRTASEAAEALSISVNHYYLLERRALQGLALACEPQPKGPRGSGAGSASGEAAAGAGALPAGVSAASGVGPSGSARGGPFGDPGHVVGKEGPLGNARQGGAP